MTQAAAPDLRSMPEEHVRALLAKQLAFGPPADGSTEAEQLKWLALAERRLWGASIMLQHRLEMPVRQGDPLQLPPDADPLEHAWLKLYQHIAAVKRVLPFGVAWEWAMERNQRWWPIYHDLMQRMGKPHHYPDPTTPGKLVPWQASGPPAA